MHYGGWELEVHANQLESYPYEIYFLNRRQEKSISTELREILRVIWYQKKTTFHKWLMMEINLQVKLWYRYKVSLHGLSALNNHSLFQGSPENNFDHRDSCCWDPKGWAVGTLRNLPPQEKWCITGCPLKLMSSLYTAWTGQIPQRDSLWSSSLVQLISGLKLRTLHY